VAKGRLLGTYLALVFVTAVAWAGIDAVGARFAESTGSSAAALGVADAWRIHQLFPWFGTVQYLRVGHAAAAAVREVHGHYVEAHNDYCSCWSRRLLVAVPALVLACRFAREVRRRFREGRDDRTGYWSARAP